MGLHYNMAAGFPHNMAAGLVSNPRESWESFLQMRELQSFQSFYNLILEVTSYHFCHILFVRIESVSIAQAQEKTITQRSWIPEGGDLGGHLSGWQPQPLTQKWTSGETLHTSRTREKEGRTKILFKKTKLTHTITYNKLSLTFF